MSRAFRNNSSRTYFVHTGLVAFAMLTIAIMVALL